MAFAAVVYFGQDFVFCRLLNKCAGIVWNNVLWADLQTFLVETIPHCFWLKREDRQMPPEVFCKKKKLFAFRKNFAIFTRKHLCWSLFQIKKTRTQMFSCEYWEISENTYFEEHLRTAASEETLESDCLGLSFWRVPFKPEPSLNLTLSLYSENRFSMFIINGYDIKQTLVVPGLPVLLVTNCEIANSEWQKSSNSALDKLSA